MRLNVVRGHSRFLTHGVALLLICGSAAGCSSTASRFGFDNLLTGSTSKDATALPPASQPYPGTPAPALMPAPASPVTRGTLAPIASSPLPPPAAVTPAPVKAAAAPSLPSTSKLASAAPLPSGVKRLGSPESKVPTPSAPPIERVAQAGTAKPNASAPKVEQAKKPAVAKTEGNGKTYTVAAGDSLNKIAARTGVPVADLRAANKIGSGGIAVGQTLVLAKGASAKTSNVAAAKPAPSLDPIKTASSQPKAEVQPAAYTPPQQPAAQVLKEAESESSADVPDASGAGKMRWPVRGRVVGKFGGKGSQASEGLDIAVPEGTPVKAAENGVVIYAGNGLKEFGNTVLVRHDDGLVTVYGHASQIKVTRGEKVTRGQDIALSGMSGTTDTPMLHFEVRKNSAPVDPATFLQ